MNSKGTIYEVKTTRQFDKSLKKISKQGKDLEKLIDVVEKLADGIDLDEKYRNHHLNDSKYYKDCYECHIEPDWLLVYKYNNNELILLLFATGSHSELFN